MEKRKRKSVSKLIFYIGLISIPIIKFCIFYIYGNFSAFAMALQRYDQDSGAYLWNGLENFRTVLYDLKHDILIKTSMKNTMIVFGLNFLTGFPLSILCAYYVYKKKFMHGIFQFILYLPVILSIVVMSTVYKTYTERVIPELMLKLFDLKIEGLLYNYKTQFFTIFIFGIWAGVGGRILVLVGTMSNIPQEIVESANMDNCAGVRELFYITIPMIWPTMVVLLVTQLSGIFGEQFNLYALFESGADAASYTIGYYFFNLTAQATYAKFPYISAFGMMATLVLVPTTFLVRWLLETYGPKEV